MLISILHLRQRNGHVRRIFPGQWPAQKLRIRPRCDSNVFCFRNEASRPAGPPVDRTALSLPPPAVCSNSAEFVLLKQEAAARRRWPYPAACCRIIGQYYPPPMAVPYTSVLFYIMSLPRTDFVRDCDSGAFGPEQIA
ncbi:hypothetical protein GWI33_006362 [Rhynchophorus ferrugineus]|uniref:Uncharacterized protein n=1 Tax=Rhynchophorus ferrugineus TaxID=354439 RepID=A0A834IWG0_RHYFE|nr:hypothetical protein GWI33_006362 [Rhynchophorus ferrugineus]